MKKSDKASWLLDKLQFMAPFVVTRAPISNIDYVSAALNSIIINSEY